MSIFEIAGCCQIPALWVEQEWNSKYQMKTKKICSLSLICQHHPELSEFGKIRFHLLDHIVMQHRDGFKDETVLFFGKADQVFGFFECAGKWFFKDNIFLQCSFRVFI